MSLLACELGSGTGLTSIAGMLSLCKRGFGRLACVESNSSESLFGLTSRLGNRRKAKSQSIDGVEQSLSYDDDLDGHETSLARTIGDPSNVDCNATSDGRYDACDKAEMPDMDRLAQSSSYDCFSCVDISERAEASEGDASTSLTVSTAATHRLGKRNMLSRDDGSISSSCQRRRERIEDERSDAHEALCCVVLVVCAGI